MCDGIIKIEMHFLADVYVPCEVVQREALQQGNSGCEVIRGKNIADVLDMTVEEALPILQKCSTYTEKTSNP